MNNKLPVKRLTQYFAELDAKRPASPDKHSKYCCRRCGCKFGDFNCSVLAGDSPQMKRCNCGDSGSLPVVS